MRTLPDQGDLGSGPLDDATFLRGSASLASLAIVAYSVAANLTATWPQRAADALVAFGAQHRESLDLLDSTLVMQGLPRWAGVNIALRDERIRPLFRRSEIEPTEVLTTMRDLEWTIVDHNVFVAGNASQASVRQLAGQLGAASARRAAALAVGGLQQAPAEVVTTTFRDGVQILP